ncbi:MAG: saccharopine dehydrogenase NADP-binding domain-containing protein [Pseudomonadota bacterium]
MSDKKDIDIVVYGATGYTGKLVAEYLGQQYGVGGELSWALAGRSLDKLKATRQELDLPADIPLVVADASDSESLASMVERARVVLTTVGPYQLYGNELLAACAKAGTDYVDLCGEPNWMRKMIDAHTKEAQDSGARIVFSCGFDSIPFDLGVHYLQQAAQQQHGGCASQVRGRVRAMNGTWSGGTLASFKATLAATAENPELISVIIDPFALTPGHQGAPQPDGTQPLYDDVLQSWVAPFVMAIINTKNIHRSNLLLGHPYGEDFAYDEMLITGSGDEGEAMAKAVASDNSMATDPTPPGEGPSREQREAGHYDVLFVGEGGDWQLRASVKGDLDPGYGSTSKMIAEAAVCLVKHPDLASGGIWTPASALGNTLIDRLQSNAGLTFALE